MLREWEGGRRSSLKHFQRRGFPSCLPTWSSGRRETGAVERGQHASAGSPRSFGPLVRWPSGALTLPDCFRGEQLGSKDRRRDFLTSGKRQRRAHNCDPPAHFLKELQTPKTAAACGGQTGSNPFGFTGSFPYYQLSGILKTHWRPPPVIHAAV